MSKNKIIEETPKQELKNDKKETPSPEEVIQTLRVQLREHQKQAEHHTTMAVKAQGALEVLLQLHPETDSGEES